MGERLSARLASLKKDAYFSRTNRLVELTPQAFDETLRHFQRRIGLLLSLSTWEAQWNRIKQGGAHWAFFLLAIAFTLFRGEKFRENRRSEL